MVSAKLGKNILALTERVSTFSIVIAFFVLHSPAQCSDYLTSSKVLRRCWRKNLLFIVCMYRNEAYSELGHQEQFFNVASSS
mmetsp:Transcript_7165/g.10649  ORF Transcript_7165/g.10649 Transcript_7165/m.10649 type:complete len:82 (+) Transcript_7165:932-1177(+)